MRNVQAGVMLLGAAGYLGAMFVTFFGVGGGLGLIVPTVWNVLLVVVAALVIVDSVRKLRAGETERLATDLLVVKLASIPFFVTNFVVLAWVAFFGSTLVVFGGSPIEGAGSFITVGAITVGLTYLAMLTTSTSGWAAIAALRRDGRIGTPLAALYRVLLLIFVGDVVAAVLIHRHARRAAEPTPTADPGRPIVRFVQAGTLILGSVMYALVIAFAGDLSSAYSVHLLFFIVGIWNTLLLVVTGFVAVDAVRKIRAGRTQELATGTLMVKLAAIPFFVLNFGVLAALALGGMIILVVGGVVLLFAVWIGIGLTYLAMLSTSVYAWATIARLRREKIIGSGLAGLYTVLTFGFVTDIAAGILLFGHARRRPGLAATILLVSIGLILTVPGALIGDLGFSAESGLEHLDATLDGLSIGGIALAAGTLVIAVVRGAILRRRRLANAAKAERGELESV